MKQKNIIMWVLLGTILLVAPNLPSGLSDRIKAMMRESVAPLQEIITGFSNRIGESVRVLRGVGGVFRDNREMSAELVRLRSEVRAIKAVERENIALRSELQFLRRSKRELIPCEVIARDISGWWQAIRLGKGTLDKIEIDHAVITAEGLIGRTISVSKRTTEVLLISDEGCKVSARTSRSSAFGILRGVGVNSRGQGRCRLEFINKNIHVRLGEEVLTSGLGGVFPKGILIGYIENISMDESGLYQHADVLPKAELGRLSYVFVVDEARATADQENKPKGVEP